MCRLLLLAALVASVAAVDFKGARVSEFEVAFNQHDAAGILKVGECQRICTISWGSASDLSYCSTISALRRQRSLLYQQQVQANRRPE